jgi:N-acetylglucosaminyl-diphospho-decaprenol L-rhamnosyltransferase
VTLSIVSHGQGDLIRHLLSDLARLALPDVRLILTLNLPEDERWIAPFSNLYIEIIRNDRPLGFGANHNQAFARCADELFCVVNPDVRLTDSSFITLARHFDDDRVGSCAPLVTGPAGEIQDSARLYPEPMRLARRLLTRSKRPDYTNDALTDVDWTAGMFIMFRRTAFASVGGFDERYFMYLEDADICRRLRRAGWRVLYQPAAVVIHDARRASHRSFRHLRWHCRSMIRFLTGL